MIRKFFASLFIIIFTVLSLPISLAYGIYITFSNENFYKNEFVDLGYDVLAEAIPKVMSKAVEAQMGSMINEEGLREIFKNVLRKEDLALVIDEIVRQFKTNSVKTVEGKGSVIEYKIPLKWFVDKKDLIAKEIKTKFKLPLDKNLLAKIPNEFKFELPIPPNINLKTDLATYIGSIADLVFLIGGGVLLFLLIIIGLIIFRPWCSVMKWEGKALLNSSVFIGIITAVLFFLPKIIQKFAFLENMDLLFAVYSLIVNPVVNKLLYIIIPVFVIALAARIVGGIYERKKI